MKKEASTEENSVLQKYMVGRVPNKACVFRVAYRKNQPPVGFVISNAYYAAGMNIQKRRLNILINIQNVEVE